jgi:hypothetical protein
MNKGDKVAYDEGNNAVRTSVSQDRMTATPCTEELFLGLYIYSSLHISERPNVGIGEDTYDQSKLHIQQFQLSFTPLS